MRHENPIGRFNPDSQFSAEGHYHHGFHGGPILFIAIGLLLIILAWVFWKKIKKRRTDINQLVQPAFISDKHSVMYDAQSAQRAAALDQWERNLLKEDNINGHL
ncbi:hypothetical protein [Paenibacillus aceris]|uniref:LPXTG cell wall anchor domain-containing protein n=1 Tax=Paenibacillus aceris TaxID=869555 RepID=A0ABS4HQP6_9BACL|nr:hypothetical protein [Paenibacillus aceris]MBP1960931.1 hypothetical protein [Paenibacillus aceris]NHW35399.1 hypothetical protein [Paenibacillus aceris]